MKLSARIVHVHVGVGRLFRERKKIGIWALDIGSNGCRLTSIAWNWKLNESEREMNTRRLIQLTELWSEQIEARLWDMFRPDPLGGAISRQSRLVYICVGHTVWRVIGVWGYKSRVEVRCITFLNRSYQRVIFGYSFEEWNVLMYRLLQCMFEQLDRRYLMRQPVEALGLYVVMICTGDLETSLDVGHDWVSISGEIIQVRKYVDAATLKPNNSTLFLFGAVPMRPLTEVSADITEW